MREYSASFQLNLKKVAREKCCGRKSKASMNIWINCLIQVLNDPEPNTNTASKLSYSLITSYIVSCLRSDSLPSLLFQGLIYILNLFLELTQILL